MAREDIISSRIVTVTDIEGKQLEIFNFNCAGIRSLKGLTQGLWSLNGFSEGLSGRNGFSDVDAHTEIDGRSLVLEFKKSLRGVNRGQVMKAFRQAQFQKTCTWFIEGDTDTPVRLIQVNECPNGEPMVTDIIETNLLDLQRRISNWEKWSKQNSLVKGNKTAEWHNVDKFINKCRTSCK